MSLKINLNESSQKFIVTVTECVTLTDPSFLMVLTSDFTNKRFSFILGTNSSPLKERYDEFIIQTNTLPEMERGNYVYKIYEFDENENEINQSKYLEIGLLDIVNTNYEDIDYITDEGEETDDDFITYDPFYNEGA